MGLTSLNEMEMMEFEGGSFWGMVGAAAGLVASQAAIVAGVITLQPELVYSGAVGTGLALDYIDRNA